MDYREKLKEKNRIVVKIGSSSLTHKETGGVDLGKMEKLVRVLTNLLQHGKRCGTGFIRCRICRKKENGTAGRKAYIAGETGMCSRRTVKTYDDLPEAVQRI